METDLEDPVLPNIKALLFFPGAKKAAQKEGFAARHAFLRTATCGATGSVEALNQGLLSLAKDIRIHPFNCLVFASRNAEALATKAANMKCIGIGADKSLPDAPSVARRFSEIDIEAMIETGRKKVIEAEPWTVTETELDPRRAGYWESVFAMCNGYMGLRGTYEEEYAFSNPGMYGSGVFENVPVTVSYLSQDAPKQFQFMLNLSDWRVVRLFIGGEEFRMDSGAVSEYRRSLDMKKGMLERSLVWTSPRGKKARIRTLRMVSMARRHSSLLRYEVTPLNFSGALRFESVIHGRADTRGAGKDAVRLKSDKRDGSIQALRYATRVSGFETALACGHSARKGTWSVKGEEYRYSAPFRAVEGATVTFDKHACFFTSLEKPKAGLVAAALRQAKKDIKDGADRLLSEQAAFWQRHWDQADIRVDGPVADQQALRFNLFQLRQNHPEDSLRSISATGVTGDNYLGWIFWDTEIFMFPHFLHLDLKLARSLLMYRYRRLDGARHRATVMGYRGASFPWSTIDGDETNIDFLVGFGQYHISCDIMYALRRYFHASGDADFLFRCGAEMLFESCRFFADLGAFIPERGNRFCINFVSGPDEYSYAVNNNCYTNALVKYQMEFALKVHALMKKQAPGQLKALAQKIGLKDAELRNWGRIAEKMFIPFNKKLGIHEQDDSYLFRDPVDMSLYPKNYEIKKDLSILALGRMRLTKQADTVLMDYLLGERIPERVKKADFEFYEPLTLHASSLSPAVHGIMASELGRDREAYDYFRQSAFMDLYDFKGNTPAGIHLACVGGVWQSVANGFLGMRDYEAGLLFEPRLPKTWDSYSLKLLVRGSLLAVRVSRQGAVFGLLNSKPLSFRSAGKSVRLEKPGDAASTGLSG